MDLATRPARAGGLNRAIPTEVSGLDYVDANIIATTYLPPRWGLMIKMGFLLRLLYLGLINTLLALGSTILLCKWLVGWHLQRSTSARRQLILARIEVEEKDHLSKLRHSSRSEDGDWEKVESHASGFASNGERSQDDWKGIVGFFHPFW